jgi:hypothetical protein
MIGNPTPPGRARATVNRPAERPNTHFYIAFARRHAVTVESHGMTDVSDGRMCKRTMAATWDAPGVVQRSHMRGSDALTSPAL